MNWYIGVLKKYAVFRGRARRKEFWMFIFFNLIATFALSFLDIMMGTFNWSTGGGPLSGLYGLGVLIPSVAVTVRRLHDTGRSGWWFLIGFIPLLGGLILLYFAISDSQPGTNQYGPNPKESGAAPAMAGV